MKNFSNLPVIITVATLALAGAAEARNHGRGDGWKQGRPSMQRPANSRRFDGNVDRRQARQRARIRDARRNGTLSSRETRHLRKDQRRIARMDRRFAADGRYTPRERQIMKHSLDRSSKRIWRKKHNGHYGPRGFVGKHHYRRHPLPGWKHHYRRGWKRHLRRNYYHHSRHSHPVYEQADSYGYSVDVETDGIRIGWSESG